MNLNKAVVGSSTQSQWLVDKEEWRLKELGLFLTEPMRMKQKTFDDREWIRKEMTSIIGCQKKNEGNKPAEEKKKPVKMK